jgi:sulfate transport system ATP-binding protein
MTGGAAESKAAVGLGGQLARMAHARVTLLAHGLDEARAQEELQRAREQIGSGLASLEPRSSPLPLSEALENESARQHYDLVVQGLPAKGRTELAGQLLQACDYHLLLVPQARPIPSRVLVCVAVGEPGKEDVQFTARLIRHLGAEATILTVLPRHRSELAIEQAERFMAGSVRTMSLLGVPARTVIRTGEPLEEILGQAKEEKHELLILGTPLAARWGRVTVSGLVGSLLGGVEDLPFLIVRSSQAGPGK